jgi:hypothetical protein
MSKMSESRTVSAAAAGDCPNCGGPRADLSAPCPQCGAPALGPAAPAPGADGTVRAHSITEALMQVRATDIEPYIGLRYLSKLFRLMALLLLVLLIAEIAIGLRAQGTAAIPTLVAEMTRLIVLAGILWGVGDLAILLIDVGHDVRAARILIGRQAAHHVTEHHPEVSRPAPESPRRERERPSR